MSTKKKAAAPGVVGLYDEAKAITQNLMDTHTKGDASIVAYLVLSAVEAINITTFVRGADE